VILAPPAAADLYILPTKSARPTQAAFEVVVGGLIVFATGILIGSA
jgi:hypothetical protein